MNSKISKTIYWSPRILGLLFTVFMSLFATDVFNYGYSFIKTILSFIMQLIPALVILLFTILGWRKAGLGAILFIILGLVYMFWFEGAEWIAKIIISGPLYLIGILFLVEKILKETHIIKTN